MDAELIKAVSRALNVYRHAVLEAADEAEKEDYSRLAAITDKIIAAMRSDDMDQVRLGVLGFSRQVSDSFSIQPPEFKLLAELIAQVKRAAL
ncbi:MAG: hypothetical protein IPO00_03445 [Betaproteobacteria bacterium]|jgi:hypothetical protein|nr:hypothetical protein [Betaproteobacteria bacterium]